MYRRLLINIHQVRNGLIHAQKTRTPSVKCKENEGFAHTFWTTGSTSHRPLGTSSICFSDNKESSTSLSDDKEKRREENEAKAEVGTDGQRNTEIKKGPDISNTALTSELETEVELKPKEIKKPEKEKTGKESLLELLGAMKVDVTTVRKVRPPRFPRISEKPSTEQMESTQSMFQDAMAEGSKQRETLNPALVAAASAAASTLPNSQQVESELLQQLRKHEAEPDAQRADRQNIGDIIADMKVGKRQMGRSNSRPSNQIRFDDDGQGYTEDRSITSELMNGIHRRKNSFTGKRLNIFSPGMEQESSEMGPTLWDIDLANQIVQSTNQMPRNGFEEMMQWTKEGKLWQYPINNEAGLDEEASVPFHEHVFLEKHLESFPRQGPVRHFMELVITGLSKNHHLTVQQKQEHIAWFRDYFQQKDDVMKEAQA